MEIVNALGRRKTAIARIYLKEGKGNIQINKRDYKEFFTTPTLHYVVEQPLLLTENMGKFDISVNLKGGGITGQAEALRLAISRALIKVDPEYRAVLKERPSPLCIFSSPLRPSDEARVFPSGQNRSKEPL